MDKNNYEVNIMGINEIIWYSHLKKYYCHFNLRFTTVQYFYRDEERIVERENNTNIFYFVNNNISSCANSLF